MMYPRKLRHTILPLLLSTTTLLLQTKVASATDSAIKTLFAGDSDIEYWDETPEPLNTSTSKFPNSVNKGVAGHSCKQVFKKINQHLNLYNPEWVVLVCGENDLPDTSVSDTFVRFMKVVNAIVATGARVVYLGTKPEPDTGEWLRSRYRKYDEKIRGKATEMAAAASSQQGPPPLVMIDVYPVFQTIEEENPGSTLYDDDDLHLSKVGYDYWNTWATTALADDIGSCVRWKENVCDEESPNTAPTPDSSAAPSPSVGLPSVIVGESGVNVCSSGYQKIQSEQGCEAAMDVVGKTEFNGVETTEDWPSNCYFCDDVDDCTNGVWFNKNKVGSAVSGARPICALPGWEEDNVCLNDIDWRFKGRNCNWVGKNRRNVRCRKVGDDDRVASEACRSSCLGHGSSCYPGCVDDVEWSFITWKNRKKTCSWVGNKPKNRCKKRGEDDSLASDACALSCMGNGSECSE